ncbi:MAG: YdeI/OmpD-associated family protein [Bacteroidota bacterium]
MNSKVNWFFTKQSKWQEAYSELREIALECEELTEELKWGCPCYTNEKNNVVLIHGFKDYCALLFMQGALLKDTKKILIQQTENVQSARQIRFTSHDEVIKNKATIKSYIKEAIKISKLGLKVEMKKTTEYKVPEEFQSVLDEMPELKTAFKALTPGRQRGYLLYFSAAKQPKTRESRIEKHIQKILEGKGIDD